MRRCGRERRRHAPVTAQRGPTEAANSQTAYKLLQLTSRLSGGARPHHSRRRTKKLPLHLHGTLQVRDHNRVPDTQTAADALQSALPKVQHQSEDQRTPTGFPPSNGESATRRFTETSMTRRPCSLRGQTGSSKIIRGPNPAGIVGRGCIESLCSGLQDNDT